MFSVSLYLHEANFRFRNEIKLTLFVPDSLNLPHVLEPRVQIRCIVRDWILKYTVYSIIIEWTGNI